MPLTLTRSAAVSAQNVWTLRVFTLFVWLAVGLSVAYWVLKFSTTKPVAATVATAAPAFEVDAKAVAKLLGATDSPAKPVVAVSNTKFALTGVAATTFGTGYALIAMDGNPPRPYRVGAKLTDEFVLKTINEETVVLASSLSAPDGLTLELPERKIAVNAAPLTRPPATLENASNANVPNRFQPSVLTINPSVTSIGAAANMQTDVAGVTTGGAGPQGSPGVTSAAAAIGRANTAVANGVLLNSPDGSGSPRQPISRFVPPAGGQLGTR